ncbi:glycosyl hydrolase family 28 protein [Prevotella sp. E13-17]|uniref:glycoside hydrolase family 28 protein n=1 Tax=Prevotella sp. E13-17 TaxID=2913616 RepID=UPI001EDB6FB8|nr:glycosyl hydrolase family 28 protein [Prevotella sp. E13-17]UKK50909.1 glycosyl hydrolase family 28 protein [Prevotella sp. E13-17]
MRTHSILLLLLMTLVMSAQETYDPLLFGAKGDGLTDDAVALQKTIDRCAADGGGRVLLRRGHTFMAGPVQLKSNVELYLEATAMLIANPDESIYHLSAFGENRGEGMLWLWAEHAENISICGKGTIHGNGIRFMGAELADSYELKPLANQTFDPRPHVLTLTDVKNLTIRDVTIKEGAYWTVHLIGCDGAVIDGINLLNNLKIRNGDGIDLDHSRHVRISNCHITSGDDCICLKNRREFDAYGACHDIVVSNCVMASRSCAIKIGSENVDSIYNVLFTNCIITGSNRGLGIQNRDEGTVSDVSFSNIQMDLQLWSDVWWGKAEPIYVTSYPRANGNHKDQNWRFPKGETEGRCGAVSRIYFNNITATSPNVCFVGGDTEGKVTDVYFNNVRIHRTEKDASLLIDKRPCKGEGFIAVDEAEWATDCPVMTENAFINK